MILKNAKDRIIALWRSFLEFQQYRWERGGSCCVPSARALENNPFRFETEDARKHHCHHHNHLDN